MTVASLWRCPIKSTAGEPLEAAVIDQRGLAGDREWAAYTADGGIASGKTTRRFRKVVGLMQWRSSVSEAHGSARLIAPDGRSYAADDLAASDALTEALGQTLTLRHETTVPHHDESAVHLVTTATLRRVEQITGGRIDPLRLRANIVLDTAGAEFIEDDWVGEHLALGPEVVLRLGPGMTRCLMIDQPQAGVEHGPQMLRALGDVHHLNVGLQATVVRTGAVAIGDQATLLSR